MMSLQKTEHGKYTMNKIVMSLKRTMLKLNLCPVVCVLYPGLLAVVGGGVASNKVHSLNINTDANTDTKKSQIAP